MSARSGSRGICSTAAFTVDMVNLFEKFINTLTIEFNFNKILKIRVRCLRCMYSVVA